MIKASFKKYALLAFSTLFFFIGIASFFIFVLKEPSPVPVFIFFGAVQFICMILFALLPKGKNIPRHISTALIGMTLAIFAGIIGKQNLQIEGFFFCIVSGFFGGAIVHYMVGKILGPVITGRAWCSWGCWTAFILDFLPYKENIAWKEGKHKHFRYLSFAVSLAVVLILFFGFGYAIHSENNQSEIINSLHAVYWFVVGNILYYAIGIILAIKMKDNRAFCKYLCPASIFLKNFSRISILKIKGSPDKCTNCGACTKACPSGIIISQYIKNGERVKSTECMMCMKCIPACPQGILGVSAELDFSIKDRLKTK